MRTNRRFAPFKATSSRSKFKVLGMRVFIVCSRLCIGGAERVGVVLANGLAARGHEVWLLSNTNLDITYPIYDDVQVVNIFSSTNNKLRKWGGAVVHLRKEMKEHKPDVVIGIEETCSLIAKMASMGLNTHVICSEHNSFERPPSAPMGRMEWWMKYQMTKLYECVTVLTEADKQFVGNRLKNIVVMPNPLALEPLVEMPNKKKVILAAGRLDVWHTKGFDVLIRAWARAVQGGGAAFKGSRAAFKGPSAAQGDGVAFKVQGLRAAEPRSKAAELRSRFKVQSSRFKVQGSRFKVQGSKNQEPETSLKHEPCLKPATTASRGWRLQIAGKYDFEESYEYLKGLCKEYGVEDTVDFLGYRTDIEELYKQAEIFVLSSRYEGFGLVLIEAMSQGCACVACDYKGRQKEILCAAEPRSRFKVQGSKNEEQETTLTSEPTLKPVTNLKPETTPLRGVEVCENGILCPPDDVEALAAGMMRMMEDDEYRREVQRNSILRVKDYSIEKTVERWESLFQRLIQKEN